MVSSWPNYADRRGAGDEADAGQAAGQVSEAVVSTRPGLPVMGGPCCGGNVSPGVSCHWLGMEGRGGGWGAGLVGSSRGCVVCDLSYLQSWAKGRKHPS